MGYCSVYALVQTAHVDVEPYEGFPEVLKFLRHRGIQRLFHGALCVWLETNAPVIYKELVLPFWLRKAANKEGKLSSVRRIFGSLCSTVVTYIVMIPLSFLRTRLIVQDRSGAIVYNNTFDCIQKVISTEGLSAFIPIGSATAHLFDDIFGILVEWLPLSSLSKTFLRVADVVLVALPLMSIDTRLFCYQSPYRGFFDCAQRVIKEEGIHGFYKGVDSLLWTIPVIVLFSWVDTQIQRCLWRWWLERRRNRVEFAEFTRKVQRIQTAGIL
jgi:hypothetical protein